MAADKKGKGLRGHHSVGFFKTLDNTSTADFYLQSKKKRITLDRGRYFEVERILTSRGYNENKEFLVKWTGYDDFAGTWEPEDHLNEECLRYFRNPNPKQSIILDEVSKLKISLAQSLYNPKLRQRLTFNFREDVFKYLFGGRGSTSDRWQVLQKEDFNPIFFSGLWDSHIDIHGQGTKVHFPVKIRHFISWSPPGYLMSGEKAPRAFIERMSMDFIKIAA